MRLPQEVFQVKQIEVRRLQIRGAHADPHALQWQLNRTLAAADWLPAGLSATALIVIRRFRAPLPVALLQAQSNARLQRDWEQRTAERIEQVINQAAHPARGTVAANAEAVFFADQAELLACLAEDWSRGMVGACWWWRSLFGAIDLSRLAAQAWLASPEYVPAALAQLAQRGSVAAFVRALSLAEVRALRQTVATCFALQAVEQQLTALEAVLAQNNLTASETGLHAALWLPHVPECTAASLRFTAQSLVGVGLLLARAPAVVRSRRFAQRLQEQLTMVVAAARPSEERKERTGIEPQRTLSQYADWSIPAQEAAIPEQEAAGYLATEARQDSSPATTADPVADRVVAQGDSLHSSEPIRCDPEPQEAIPFQQQQGLSEQTAWEIETEFGGVFYFINLALFLGFYGDFTTPQQDGLDLPLWDFVALAGQRLAGEEIIVDPVWALLAQLAGRSAEPGDDFTPPPAWQVKGDWRDWLTTTLRARLQAALGVNDAEELGQLVCRAHARLRVTATHLDVMLSLSELPIGIRLAGLDRNPGWVPAAGRYITFHFD